VILLLTSRVKFAIVRNALVGQYAFAFMSLPPLSLAKDRAKRSILQPYLCVLVQNLPGLSPLARGQLMGQSPSYYYTNGEGIGEAQLAVTERAGCPAP
jgi:hypothetical protein